MIQANELRIGNWVQRPKDIRNEVLDGGQVYWLVDHIMVRDCEYYKDNWAFEPIPLSPEILEKCGCSQLPYPTIQNSYFKELGRGRVISIACVGKPNEMVFLTEKDSTSVIVLRNYVYDGYTHLHQLQNLYFALAGQELEISL